MDIAYIISAYKYPGQLMRLIRRLHTDATSFFIHIDKKAGSVVYDQAVQGIQDLPNIYFLQRYRCDWGGFGHVQATLEGIHEVMQRGIPFDYVILLTGQDYPIKTNDHIQDFLRQQNGKSFMDYFPLPSSHWEGGGLQRVELWHVRFLNRHFLFPRDRDSFFKRKFPKMFRPFGGCSYWCLSKEVILYIHQFTRQHPKFTNFFKYVDVPDEIFFQTIVMNSSYASSIVNDDLRYILWKDWNAGSPSILLKEDLEGLASSPKFFARKFDENVDAEVLNLIDQKLLTNQ
jgi:hypothetical protein